MGRERIDYTDMTCPDKPVFDHDRGLVIVSAFLDIDRGDWDRFSRSASDYLSSFAKYQNYDTRMVVFIDDRHIDEIRRHARMTLIPINRAWLGQHIFAWQRLGQHTAIMSSEDYRNRVRWRIESGFPENIFPEYNAINHSKIDFICYALKNHLIDQDDIVCWSDFGYFYSILKNDRQRFPRLPLDARRFAPDRLTFCLRNKIEQEDADVIHTLTAAPERFTGSFFAGPAHLMPTLRQTYHECLDDLASQNVCDDDQHIYLRCFLKAPHLFSLYLSPHEWPTALLYFQKDDPNCKH